MTDRLSETPSEREVFVDRLMGRMSLEQKVGQCLVIGFTGTVVTPDLLRRIRQVTPAGIRVATGLRVKTARHDSYGTGTSFMHRALRPARGGVKDYVVGLPAPHCSNAEYCAALNRLKREALGHGAGIPVHITLDMEGNMSADYGRGGIHVFPHAMGLAKTGDPSLARRVAWAVGRQVGPLGFNWIHSPVLDVNTEPRNPEISTRSYSADFEEATRFALEALKGFRDAGLIATGKHFPGRGASAQDAHGELPVIDLSDKELRRHLLPFKALIDAGLPAIMSAHTAYPAFDASGRAASLSKPILTDLLKNELGFQGVVTTDDITMGGILQNFEVVDACIEALKAGNDLILMRDESTLLDDVFPALVAAVRRGELPAARLDDAVRRVLSVKFDYGLFRDNGLRDEAAAGDGIADPRVLAVARDAGRRCVAVLRDRAGLLPLSPARRILLVEQVNPLHLSHNSQACHPGLLWEKMWPHCPDVAMVETSMAFDGSDRERVLARLDEAEVLVVTNYYYRRADSGTDFVSELLATGKPMVVVTNNPYKLTVDPKADTVIVTYGVGPESLAAVAATLFGACPETK